MNMDASPCIRNFCGYDLSLHLIKEGERDGDIKDKFALQICQLSSGRLAESPLSYSEIIILNVITLN